MAKPRLTVKEKRLLRYPPTPDTWECSGHYDVIRQDDVVKVRCGWINSGSAKECVGCGKAKGKRPHRIYPEYAAACKKAGIEPGQKWRDPAAITPTAQQGRKRR